MDRSPAPARLARAVSSRPHPARESTLTARPEASPFASPFAWPTLALVRSVPAAALEGVITDAHLRETARFVAEDARGQGLAVERLLVALKGVWAGLAEVRQLPAHDARDLLDQLVSLCIRAYYGHDGWGADLDSPGAARVGEAGNRLGRSAGDARIA